MCLTPILIKNQSRYYSGRIDSHKEFHDTTSQFIYVPCGHCAECFKKKQLYIVQRTQLEALDSYLFFCTLTYQDSMIPYLDIGDFRHFYPDFHDFQTMIKRCRKDDRWNVSKYLVVSEYGGKRHRPHFHVVFFVKKSEFDNIFTPINYQSNLFSLVLENWSRNLGSRKFPKYVPLCQYVRRGKYSTFDLHYVDPCTSKHGLMDVAFYVSKYCLKFDDWSESKRKALYLNLSPEEYRSYWNLFKPRIRSSHGFGLSDVSSKYLRKCIDEFSNNSDFPMFRNPLNGQLSPMSPYLFNKVGTLLDKERFYLYTKDPDSSFDSFHYSDIDYDVYQSKCDKFDLISSQIVDTDVYDFL